MVPRNHRTALRTALALAAALMLVAASCSSDDSDDTTTTSEATETTASSGGESSETKAYNEEIQKELAEVGCYKGADDGVIGPETDAAIVAFQTAEGLTADGEIGPKTQSALTAAVQDGRTVCGDTPPSTTTTTTPSGGTAPCTATAIQAALPSGDTGTGYVCSEGYAGVSLSDGSGIVLQSVDGKWTVPGQDPCGSASAGIPPEVLEKGCPAS